MVKPKSGWRRDLTLDSSGNTWFFAPYTGVFWIINQSGAPVTYLAAGKATYIIPDQSFYKFEAEGGDQIGLTNGTAGKIVTVTDEADVKPIPQTKDIQGKFLLADSTGANIAGVDSSGNVSVKFLSAQAVTVPLNPTVEFQGRKGGDAGALGTPSLDNTTVAGFTLLYVEPLSTVNGGFGWASANDNTSNLGGKLPTLPATAVSVAPSNTASNQVPLYEDTSGNLFVRLNSVFFWLQANLLTEQENLAPTSVAAASAETTQVTGTTTLTLGENIDYNLTSVGALATVADVLTYVALKGATSGRYYAVCGPNQVISGRFAMATTEKLNIVTRNQDTVAHGFSAFWAAMTHT